MTNDVAVSEMLPESNAFSSVFSKKVKPTVASKSFSYKSNKPEEVSSDSIKFRDVVNHQRQVLGLAPIVEAVR